MIKEELYRKGLYESNPLRICVSSKEGGMIARSIHQGSKNLVKQIQRQGYYWARSESSI